MPTLRVSIKIRLEFTTNLGNWKMETRNWKMENGKWKMDTGKWEDRTVNAETRHRKRAVTEAEGRGPRY